MNSIFSRLLISLEAVFYPAIGKAKKNFVNTAKERTYTAGPVSSPDSYNSRGIRKNNFVRYSPAP